MTKSAHGEVKDTEEDAIVRCAMYNPNHGLSVRVVDGPQSLMDDVKGRMK